MYNNYYCFILHPQKPVKRSDLMSKKRHKISSAISCAIVIVLLAWFTCGWVVLIINPEIAIAIMGLSALAIPFIAMIIYKKDWTPSIAHQHKGSSLGRSSRIHDYHGAKQNQR